MVIQHTSMYPQADSFALINMKHYYYFLCMHRHTHKDSFTFMNLYDSTKLTATFDYSSQYLLITKHIAHTKYKWLCYCLEFGCGVHVITNKSLLLKTSKVNSLELNIFIIKRQIHTLTFKPFLLQNWLIICNNYTIQQSVDYPN